MFVGMIEKTAVAGRERWSAHGLAVLRHPLLEDFFWQSDELTVWLCREKCPSAEGQPDMVAEQGPISAAWLKALLRAQERWPLDWQAVILDHREVSVAFHAGHGGVAPLYLRPTGWAIEISWDMADFYAGASASEVDCDWTAFRLTGNPPYGASTMLHNLYMLTERACILVDSMGAARVDYPDPAPYYIPTPLRADVDVPVVACALIEGLIARWPLEHGMTAAEFSGGMDSAVTAGLLATMSDAPLTTLALEIAGPAAAQQRARRALAVRHFRFRDRTMPVDHVQMLPEDLSGAADYQPTPRNADL